MRTQRSIRRLKPDPVDDALMLRLIELAEKAPTGGNVQNWEFVVVRDRALKERLGRLNRRAWRVYGGIGRLVSRGRPNMRRILDAVDWQAEHFAEIPVVGVACLRGVRLPFPRSRARATTARATPRCRNLLAARAAGLGAGLITLPLWMTWLARRASGCPGTGLRARSSPCAGPGALRPHDPAAGGRDRARGPLRQPAVFGDGPSRWSRGYASEGAARR
jgi:hypothetical protein